MAILAETIPPKRRASSILANITSSYATKRVRRRRGSGSPAEHAEDPIVSSDDEEEESIRSTPIKLSHRQHVRFDPRIRYYPIPTHRDYETAQKQRIWTQRQELRTEAQRNRREFAYEEHDWNKVVLEQDFVWDSARGQHVHPAHITTVVPEEQLPDDAAELSE